MNASRCWIVEEHVAAGPEPTPSFGQRNRSRFSEWKEKTRRKNKEIRPEHWRIIRTDGNRWEDVRRRDRMILPEAMEAIRTLHQQFPGLVFRVRSLKDDHVIMGAIVCADIPRVQPGGTSAMRPQNNGFGGGGVSHSKN
jgi:hypothetical protein